MTTLVVEDEATLARLIQEMFEARGTTCLTATSVGEADWTARTAKVDAIALDLGLPGPSPIAWLESLCAERPALGRCTVVISGRFPDADELRRIRACGAGDMLKPFRIDALLEELRARVEKETGGSGVPAP